MGEPAPLEEHLHYRVIPQNLTDAELDAMAVLEPYLVSSTAVAPSKESSS